MTTTTITLKDVNDYVQGLYTPVPVAVDGYIAGLVTMAEQVRSGVLTNAQALTRTAEWFSMNYERSLYASRYAAQLV